MVININQLHSFVIKRKKNIFLLLIKRTKMALLLKEFGNFVMTN